MKDDQFNHLAGIFGADAIFKKLNKSMFNPLYSHMNAMDNNAEFIESLFEKATDYGQTSFKLAKLKALDKTSDIVSTLIPSLIVFGFILTFTLFLNLGIAFLIGEILGNSYYGFFVIAAFYGISGIFIRLFMYKWLKRVVRNKFINQMLN